MNRLINKLAVLLISATVCFGAVAAQSANMTENERMIREFVDSWSGSDAEEFANYFTEDGIYHNVPSGAV